MQRRQVWQRSMQRGWLQLQPGRSLRQRQSWTSHPRRMCWWRCWWQQRGWRKRTTADRQSDLSKQKNKTYISPAVAAGGGDLHRDGAGGGGSRAPVIPSVGRGGGLLDWLASGGGGGCGGGYQTVSCADGVLKNANSLLDQSSHTVVAPGAATARAARERAITDFILVVWVAEFSE